MAEEEVAMIELTEQQQQAVDASAEPRLIDPRTKKTFVLVPADVYERSRELFFEEDGLDMRQVAALVERVMREEDEADPTLSYYQQKYGKQS
jgi:hypothetical protein